MKLVNSYEDSVNRRRTHSTFFTFCSREKFRVPIPFLIPTTARPSSAAFPVSGVVAPDCYRERVIFVWGFYLLSFSVASLLKKVLVAETLFGKLSDLAYCL